MNLIEQIKYFELLKPEIDKEIKKDEIYRANFVKKYSINKIENMHIDDIVFRTLLKSVFAIFNRRIWLCV